MAKRALKEYLLFMEAWIFLAIARMILVVLPFKRIAPMLGKLMSDKSIDDNEQPTGIVQNIGICILRAGRYSPWRTKCFEQAIAAKIMLRLRSIKSLLFLGVFKDAADELKAHAWLTVDKIVVTGGPDVTKYTVVSWFGS
ncbi:MAG: hypothetical protein JWQ38_3498 [Flavipsychrobacter sp.]|nr:hypothetical protein [Flavipsychrobacter sp.]